MLQTEAKVASEVRVNDPVNHPAHYTSGGIECIDAIDAALSCYPTGKLAFLAGQVIKYVWRAPLKGTFKQDLEKARFYLNRMIGVLDEQSI